MTQAITSNKLVCNDFLTAKEFPLKLLFYQILFLRNAIKFLERKNNFYKNGNSNDITAVNGIVKIVQLLEIT